MVLLTVSRSQDEVLRLPEAPDLSHWQRASPVQEGLYLSRGFRCRHDLHVARSGALGEGCLHPGENDGGGAGSELRDCRRLLDGRACWERRSCMAILAEFAPLAAPFQKELAERTYRDRQGVYCEDVRCGAAVVVKGGTTIAGGATPSSPVRLPETRYCIWPRCHIFFSVGFTPHAGTHFIARCVVTEGPGIFTSSPLPDALQTTATKTTASSSSNTVHCVSSSPSSQEEGATFAVQRTPAHDFPFLKCSISATTNGLAAAKDVSSRQSSRRKRGAPAAQMTGTERTLAFDPLLASLACFHGHERAGGGERRFVEAGWMESSERSNLQNNIDDCGVFTATNGLAAAKGDSSRQNGRKARRDQTSRATSTTAESSTR